MAQSIWTEKDGGHQGGLLFAIPRVASLEAFPIARLELTAAELAVRKAQDFNCYLRYATSSE